ncbi:HprK-related kinase A [Seongchinamella sediminis]|uniref:HprK-related kinase A n=1 Tax=Seongchinamella sediminis TaxID=2283635 RepID=UPI0013C2C2E4|nr:HprK-related kinase A [Seongchinamella sediminis]
MRYRVGPFVVHLRSDVRQFLEVLSRFYAPVEMLDTDQPAHYHLSIDRVRGVRRWLRPQVQFTVDGVQPFERYPLDHAFPMYEWGLNWCIGTTAHQNLMLHSAVVEKCGRGVILPALPGSGKTTLCAGLVARGWRLLSDEFCVIRHSDGLMLPLPRAAPLKNTSIDLIGKFAPEMALGPHYEKTRKGTVAHLVPPAESLQRQLEPVHPRWIIFPSYRPGGQTMLKGQHRAEALAKLVNNSFNYPVTQQAGFLSLTRLVRSVDTYDLPNGDLEAAVSAIERLLQDDLV